MHNDDDLKKLLKNAAVEEPSAGFTNNVMNRIEMLHTSKASLQPIITARQKRAFIIAFFILAITLVIVTGLNMQDHIALAMPLISVSDFNKYGLSLVSFCFLLMINFAITSLKKRAV